MPNIKQLKALKKLMQEEGLFRQAADNYVKGSIDKRIMEKLDNPNLSLQERKAILREKGRYKEPYKIDPSTNDMINARAGDTYEDPRRAAQETQRGIDPFYSHEPYSHHDKGVYEGWPTNIVDDRIPDPLSLVSGVDKNAAEKLKAVKNYPSKNLDENQTFRDLVEHYKNYPGLTKMEEAPELWNRVLEAKTKEKFNKIKDQIKNKKSSE